MKKIEIWERTINIPISLVDFKGNIRVDSIFSIMQNEALKHSDAIGVGFNKFLKDR